VLPLDKPVIARSVPRQKAHFSGKPANHHCAISAQSNWVAHELRTCTGQLETGFPRSFGYHGDMNLTEDQRRQVATWIAQGAKLSEIQGRLDKEFGIKLTYMEARFLVDDLKLVPKDPEPAKVVEPPAAKPLETKPVPADEIAEPMPAAGPSKVSVSVDQITRPGALISGKVTFSDGQIADWYLDQMGRLGVVPKQQGYKPSAADVQDFQMALQQEVAKLGY
jgi:hypothetical protein